MKQITTLILLVFLYSNTTNSQSLNREIISKDGTPFLLGKIDKSGLEASNYSSWFSKNYNDYKPKTELINSLSEHLKAYDIKLFLGTWCGDSKKEVPKLYKVLEAANFPMAQLKVVALSRQKNLYKQSPNHEEEGLNIHRVPTIIVYKDGMEVNRIVEHPIESFEEDIKNIITTNSYKSNYQIVTAVNTILTQKGTRGLKKRTKHLIRDFEDKISSMYELNTYGYVLYGKNKKNEAIEVFKLNTKLFPEEPRTHLRLANTLSAVGQKDKAIKTLKNALKIIPDNTDLKESLAGLKSN